MNEDLLDDIVNEIVAHASEDQVGLWLVVKTVRRRGGTPDWLEIRLLGARLCQMLVSQGLQFGQYGADGTFVVWPPRDACSRIVAEWSDLGRDPDIGEIGWFQTPG